MSYSDHVMVYMFSGGRQEAVYTFLNATLAPGQNFAWASKNATLLKVSFQCPQDGDSLRLDSTWERIMAKTLTNHNKLYLQNKFNIF